MKDDRPSNYDHILIQAMMDQTNQSSVHSSECSTNSKVETLHVESNTFEELYKDFLEQKYVDDESSIKFNSDSIKDEQTQAENVDNHIDESFVSPSLKAFVDQVTQEYNETTVSGNMHDDEILSSPSLKEECVEGSSLCRELKMSNESYPSVIQSQQQLSSPLQSVNTPNRLKFTLAKTPSLPTEKKYNKRQHESSNADEKEPQLKVPKV